MEQQGHTVVVARNGIEAIELFKSEPLDLILMDIQMPHMGGLEATRRIRALESTSSNGAIPIIALTASVMSEETDSYMQSGINAVIGKPIEFCRLFDTLEHIIPEGIGRVLVEPSTVEHARLPTALPFDLPVLEGIEVEKAIGRWKNPTTYIGALIGFSQRYADAIHRISSLIDDKDIEAAKRIVHSIKGLSGNLEMPQVYRISGEVEYSLGQRDVDRAIELLKQLRVALNTVVGSIVKLDVQKQTSEQTIAILDIEKVRDILVLLMKFLKVSSPDEIEPLVMRLEQYVNAEQLGSIKRCVGELNFVEASRQAMRLATTLGINIENMDNQLTQSVR
ncbi:MAG: response regulator [Nitrospirae bacterium]|nr:response regulator [Nitrospirota bacterium]